MKTKGWGKVFKFTYVQMVKSKSFIASTLVIAVIMSLMIVGMNFIPGLFADDGATTTVVDVSGNEVDVAHGAEAFFISDIYLLDNTGLTPAPDLSQLTEAGVKVNIIDASELEAKTKEVNESTASVALFEINPNGGGSYSILASRPANSEFVDADKCSSLASLIGKAVSDSHYLSIGVTADKLNEATFSCNATVTIAGEEPISMIAQVLGAVVPMGSSLILFIFIFLYGTLVAQSIATEKTSRVMELLLTSIRPLAVIIGKVLAMGLVAVTQIAAFSAIGSVSFFACAPFGAIGQVMGMAQGMDPAAKAVADQTMGEIGKALSGFNAVSVILIVILFVLGFLFYALIAGLIGASVSRAEDLQSAMQPLSLLGILGFYLAYFPSIFSIEGDGTNALTLFSWYFPISSPFALPSAIILGKLSPLETVISIVFLAVCVVGLALLVAKVYESIILHTGNRLKITEILKMAKKK